MLRPGADNSGGGRSPSPAPMITIPYDILSLLPDHPDSKDLFTTKCSTVEEKYRMLEARDKVLRARVPKVKVRVELAAKLFGTCPDMCPEKERYMRQYQRQLTAYEMLPNEGMEPTVDHETAIKAYSRSSADQEEPLPHELRPGPVLDLTMNYLLHNIVPLAEAEDENLGDWYNFLWDRTRSIRKDITQQQLTDLRVVGLLEKCARFHIHCSSRLCELDVHHFDPKLNDENLMKCLQSLEHMYDDLRRRDINCPNEPEFRAYQVMMNLNEGDILLAVQQKPDWILKSWEVQAAIEFHHHIFNKNFVGFFRRVKQLPYMFSCILHRYFYQVRYRALLTLIRSGGRKVDVQLVLSQVQRMLGYGDDEPNQDFLSLCELHGLIVDVENDKITYNKRLWSRPDGSIMNREEYLIESKLGTSTAEAINGGPLAENPSDSYKPHFSFNDDGFLLPGLVAGEGSDFGIQVIPGKSVVDGRQSASEDRSVSPVFGSRMTESKQKSSFRFNETVFGKQGTQRLKPQTSRLSRGSTSSTANIFASNAAPATATKSNIFGFGSSAPSNTSTIGPGAQLSGSVFGAGAAAPNIFGPSSNIFGGAKGPGESILQSAFNPATPSFLLGSGSGQSSALPFGSPAAQQVRIPEEVKAKRLQKLNKMCQDKAAEITDEIIEENLKDVLPSLIAQVKDEERLREERRKQEVIMTALSEQSVEQLLSGTVSELVSGIVQLEIYKSRWINNVCELYALKFLDDTLDTIATPITRESISLVRQEEKQLLFKAGTIFRRLKLRFIVQRWKTFARNKVLERQLKEERRLQLIANFPSPITIGRSAHEILEQVRGHSSAPLKLVKATCSTTTDLLQKFKKAETLAENFLSSMNPIAYKLCPTPSPPISPQDTTQTRSSPSPKAISTPRSDYYRQCWKRKSATFSKDTRPTKSPRPMIPPKSSPSASTLSFLEEIRKFTLEAKQEKAMSQEFENTVAQLGDQIIKPKGHLNGNGFDATPV